MCLHVVWACNTAHCGINKVYMGSRGPGGHGVEKEVVVEASEMVKKRYNNIKTYLGKAQATCL